MIEIPFNEFTRRYGKVYSTPTEARFRYEVYISNCRRMEEENKRRVAIQPSSDPKSSNFAPCMLSVNKFADWTDEEFSNRRLMRIYPEDWKDIAEPSIEALKKLAMKLRAGRALQALNTIADLPRKVDWRRNGYQGRIKDQKDCSACYAFAVTGAVEMKQHAKDGTIVDLSEQEVVDCAGLRQPCVGGLPSQVMDYIIKNTVNFSTNYPYLGKKNPMCLRDRSRLLQTVETLQLPPPGPRPKRFKVFGKDRSKAYRVRLPSGEIFNIPPGRQAIITVSPEPGVQVPKAPTFGTPLPAVPKAPTFGTPLPAVPMIRPQAAQEPSSPRLVDVQAAIAKAASLTPNSPASAFQSPSPHYKIAPPSIPLPPTVPPPPPRSLKKFFGLTSYLPIPSNLFSLLLAISISPIAITHHAPPDFKFYTSGIYTPELCKSTIPNHAATAVGYDLTGPIPYLIIKNAWDRDWGENGYYRFAIGDLVDSSKGNCLIAATPYNAIPLLGNENA